MKRETGGTDSQAEGERLSVFHAASRAAPHPTRRVYPVYHRITIQLCLPLVPPSYKNIPPSAIFPGIPTAHGPSLQPLSPNRSGAQ